MERMKNTSFAATQAGNAGTKAQIDTGLRAHMNKVYGLMAGGMVITGGAAWAVGTSPALLGLFRNPETLQPNMLGWIIMFAPLIAVFALGGMINRISAAAAQTAFYAFSALMGLSISWIFVAFTGMSIAQIFLITSIAFASLSLWGYTTKTDMSGWGTFLIMGVVGLIVASIVNIFLGSPAIMFAVASIGVLIFSALTAYDTQRIKNEYVQHAQVGDAEWLDKSATMGALSLYINFINMFIMLLVSFGRE